MLRERRATKPEDKCFAVQGILNSLNIPQPEPDYQKPLGKIYHNLYEGLLRKEQRMVNLLIDAGGESLNAPSWVPNWSTAIDRAFLPTSYLVNPINDFTNDHRPALSFDGKKLGVQGIWRGIVQYISPLPNTFMNLYEQETVDDDDDGLFATQCAQMHALLVFLCYYLSQHSSARQSIEHVAELFYSTLMAHQIPFRRNMPDRGGELYDQYKVWLSETLRFCLSGISSDEDTRIAEAVQDLVKNNPDVRSSLDYCSTHLRNRVLFYSSEYGLGTAHSNIRTGHHIANIVGVAAPLVLCGRGASEAYQVVGPAFVKCLMVWSWPRWPSYEVVSDPTGTMAALLALKSHYEDPDPIPEEKYRYEGNGVYERITLI